MIKARSSHARFSAQFELIKNLSSSAPSVRGQCSKGNLLLSSKRFSAGARFLAGQRRSIGKDEGQLAEERLGKHPFGFGAPAEPGDGNFGSLLQSRRFIVPSNSERGYMSMPLIAA
jgi:hypothetical protein